MTAKERQKRTDRVVARLRELQNAGQVAREFGARRAWVSSLAKRHGVPLTNRGRPRGRQVKTRRPCEQLRLPRRGCECVTCCARRIEYRRRESQRVQAWQKSQKPRQKLWRCCGWLQQIPEGEQARCGRCGEVPLFARPDSDLRQFRNGR